MQLILPIHALGRMAERNITEADIVALIRNCPKPRREGQRNLLRSCLRLDRAGCYREGIAAATGDYREGDQMNEKRRFPSMTYDSEVDAAYIYFRQAPWDHMDILDDCRNIDYGPDGEPNGVELLYVSDGVNLDGLPQRNVIARLLAERCIPMFA